MIFNLVECEILLSDKKIHSVILHTGFKIVFPDSYPSPLLLSICLRDWGSLRFLILIMSHGKKLFLLFYLFTNNSILSYTTLQNIFTSALTLNLLIPYLIILRSVKILWKHVMHILLFRKFNEPTRLKEHRALSNHKIWLGGTKILDIEHGYRTMLISKMVHNNSININIQSDTTLWTVPMIHF